MSVAKVIEVIAQGDTVEKAFENAVSEASKSVNSIQSAWADGVEAVVKNNKIEYYKVNAKITFVVN